MNRLHISLAVAELGPSVAFYTTLFGGPPTVQEPDYAKWMLDDPRVNFVLDARGADRGVDHLGIQAETLAELDQIAARLHDAGARTVDQTGAHCCYARSDKHWVTDPQGLKWETFFTHGREATYGPDSIALHAPSDDGTASPCCKAADAAR